MRRLALAAAVLAAGALAAPAPAARVPERGFDLVVSARLGPVEPQTQTMYAIDPATGRTMRVSDTTQDAESAPTPSPGGRQLAFVRGSDGGATTWVTRRNGEPARLVGQGTDPAWAPDGRALAISAPEGVVVVSPSGASLRLVAPGGRSPSWSPDGHSIAHLTPSFQLAVVPRAGGASTVVHESVSTFAWSPDGRRLAMETWESQRWSLTIVDLQGRIVTSQPLPITATFGLAYSPSGDRIAVPTGSGILLVPSAGGRARRIGLAPYACASAPAFSPDGRTIACLGQGGGGWATFVLVVDVATGRARALRRYAWRAVGPVAWRRDGSLLVSYQGYDPGAELLRVDPATGRHVRLTRNLAEDQRPQWSPDGRRLLFSRGGRPMIMDANGRHERRAPAPSDGSALVNWWLDGEHVLLVLQGGDLRLRTLDGLTEWRGAIPGIPEAGAFPIWETDVSPDGTLAYSTFEGVWRVAVRREGSRLVVGTPELVAPSAFGARWSPSGDRLLYLRLTDCRYCAFVQVFTRATGTSGERQVAESPELRFLTAGWGPTDDDVVVLTADDDATTTLDLLSDGTADPLRTGLTGVGSFDWRAPARASGP